MMRWLRRSDRCAQCWASTGNTSSRTCRWNEWAASERIARVETRRWAAVETRFLSCGKWLWLPYLEQWVLAWSKCIIFKEFFLPSVQFYGFKFQTIFEDTNLSLLLRFTAMNTALIVSFFSVPSLNHKRQNVLILIVRNSFALFLMT